MYENRENEISQRDRRRLAKIVNIAKRKVIMTERTPNGLSILGPTFPGVAKLPEQWLFYLANLTLPYTGPCGAKLRKDFFSISFTLLLLALLKTHTSAPYDIVTTMTSRYNISN